MHTYTHECVVSGAESVNNFYLDLLKLIYLFVVIFVFRLASLIVCWCHMLLQLQLANWRLVNYSTWQQ